MDALVTVAVEVAKGLFIPLKRHASYLFCYRRNSEDLKSLVSDLEVKKNDVQRQVNDAQDNLRQPKEEVKRWIAKVNAALEVNRNIEEAMAENKKCLKWCPDLSSQYWLGKQAAEQSVIVKGLHQFGDFNRGVSHSPSRPVGFMGATSSGDFESTKKATKQVMDAITDDKTSVIGIYGLGGVGKTTLVKKIAEKLQKDTVYDVVLMASVSQSPDIKKIQCEIAEKLGFSLTEETESVRAHRLRERLKQVKKILIVLDDLWEAIDMANIGIPRGDEHRGCKVLLTTRRRDVCSHMDCQVAVNLQVLPEQDSWNLFKEKAGIAETDTLCLLARDVAKECRGLPLAIITVARALKEKPESIWANALKELRRSAPKNVDRVYAEVYSHIELSFNYLDSDEAKTCLLFCCLFPEDYDIDVEVLVKYMIGEDLFENVFSLEEARDRMDALINKLKDSCLLLEGIIDTWVKVHDIVRDVGISIASRKEYGFLGKIAVQLDEGPKNMEECKRLSLMQSSTTMLPAELVCPKLLTLLLQHSTFWYVPHSFFEAMKSLAVLDLTATNISSLPRSFVCLKGLKTLCLDSCESLSDISILGQLQKLEVLSLQRTSIKELPNQVGDLGSLKLLDLSDCKCLKMIVSNIISKLSKLEELHMLCSFNEWEITGDTENGSKASLNEITSLHYLTRLDISIRGNISLSVDIPGPWYRLKTFRIAVGCYTAVYHYGPYCRQLAISSWSNPTSKWIKTLIERSEAIHLYSCECGKNDFHLDEDHFISLKHLLGYGCPKMEHVTGTKEEGSQFVPQNTFPRINRQPIPSGFLGNLKRLDVHKCDEVEIIFSVDFPLEGLQKLEILSVWYCEKLKALFEREKGIGGDIYAAAPLLSRLKSIDVTGSDELLHIWNGPISPTGIFHNLQRLSLSWGNYRLRYVFSPSLARCLQKLEVLHIYGPALENIISDANEEETGTDSSISPSRFLLPPVPFFQNLRKLVFDLNRKMKYLLSWKLVCGLTQLEYLSVTGCYEMMEIISAKEEEEELGAGDMQGVLPRLTTLYLRFLQKITSFCYHYDRRGGGSHVILDFPSLTHLHVDGCRNLKMLPFGSQSAPKLEVIEGRPPEWFQGLQWEDDSVMKQFEPCFKLLPPDSDSD